MNPGPFMQQVPTTSQSFQSFNNPGPYPSNTPQPQVQFPSQHFPQQQQQGGFPGPQNYGGTPQARAQMNQSSSPYQQGFPATTGPSPVPQFNAPINNPQQNTGMAAPATPQQQILQQQRQQMHNTMLAQQAQLQNAANAQKAGPAPATPQSPQSAARERARVTVLLEINTQLLQEVVSLQAQGKAGVTPTQPQQSPTSPTSATDPSALNASPVDSSKQGPAKPPSQEYADCMRRLQANLSYLAAIADAKKKASGSLPSGPAIMIPPPHLTGMQDLYKKLNQLFPEASQSTVNKALAFANAQASKGQNATSVQANG